MRLRASCAFLLRATNEREGTAPSSRAVRFEMHLVHLMFASVLSALHTMLAGYLIGAIESGRAGARAAGAERRRASLFAAGARSAGANRGRCAGLRAARCRAAGSDCR